MPRGLRFDQIGVTEAMIDTWAETIWNMSNNVQIRRGDPIRLREFGRVAAERAELGMSDGQIAAALGLTRDQVMVIRSLTEARRFRRRNYFELYELARGRRFNPERHVLLGERSGFRADALALRDALRFDPAQVRRFVASGAWGADTLPGWLAAHAAAVPPSAAVRDAAGELSYAELHRQALRLAAGLHSLGIGRGDVVTVQLPNLREFLIAYAAIARIGAVLAPASMTCRDAELRAQLGHSRARALICLADAKVSTPARAPLEHVIALGVPLQGRLAFSTLACSEAPLPDDLAPAPADPLLLLYAPGKIKRLKAVPHTHQAILGNARLGAPEHGIGAGDALLSALPFSHPLGLYSVHLAASAGAANLLLPAFTAAGLAQTIAAGRPSVLFAEPAQLAAMLKSGLLDAIDLSCIRLIICSGRDCSPKLARGVTAKLPNGRFSQLWGRAEAPAGLYTRPGDPMELGAASVGRPSPGTEVRIATADGSALPAGEEGELQLRGGLLFPGYLGNPEANTQAFTSDRWFRTGECAMQDSAGNVRLAGHPGS